METSVLTTEEKIKKAALELFMRKGYNGTKTRDIAEAADINIASMHYYYRTKEKLFEIVVEEALKDFSKGMNAILNADIPLYQKIVRFVEAYIDFLKEKSFVALFIISEAHTNLERIKAIMESNEDGLESLGIQLGKLAQKGVIRSIHPAQFMNNIVSLTVFPFIAKPLLISKSGIDEQEFLKLMEERKHIVPDLIIRWLYINPPEG